MTNAISQLIPPCITLAKQAGAAILMEYQQSPTAISVKADKTPLTVADLTAHKVIEAGLQQLTPNIPILSEESAKVPFSIRQNWQRYWLVDPLDGTKEFIHHTDEFTVNIAFIEAGQAKLGVIYVPCYDTCYFATAGGFAYKQQNNAQPEKIHTRKKAVDKCTVMVSRRHNAEKANKYLQKIPGVEKIIKGSSLKTCLIAEGLADLYPCLGPTSEWDMGAAQCIIESAGGAMIDLQFKPLCFNQKDSLINPPLIVVGDPQFNWAQFFLAN